MGRWYFGGLASAGAACCTHPLDLVKVQLQTKKDGNIGALAQAKHIIRSEGFLALYNGLSASLVRQLTYSTTRFAIYEVAKQSVSPNGEPIPFTSRLGMAAVAGACGGFVGTPGDMTNVRMQNDMKLPPDQRRNYKHAIDGMARVYREEGLMKLPPDQRRNYKHAIDGMARVYREEGLKKLFSGADWATGRAILMTIGQLCFYDQIKQTLLATDYFQDNLVTHFTSSLGAGAIATTMTQPLDVMKTRSMNAKAGEFAGSMDIVRATLKEGPMAFYKGYIPAFLRLGPQTILTFVFFEQLRMNFGFIPEQK